MQRLFLITMAAVVTLAIALGVFLYVSLVPYFGPIGKVAAGVVITGLACVAILICAFTYSRVGILLAHRRREALNAQIIVSGEVVVFPNGDGTFTHLSAMHEAAKLAPQVTVKEIAAPKPVSDKETVLELFDQGISLRTIAESTGLTYYQVQKITSEAKR